jgi:hypothetical protein
LLREIMKPIDPIAAGFWYCYFFKILNTLPIPIIIVPPIIIW